MSRLVLALFTILVVVTMWALTISYVYLNKTHEISLIEYQLLEKYCNMTDGNMVVSIEPNGHVDVYCMEGETK